MLAEKQQIIETYCKDIYFLSENSVRGSHVIGRPAHCILEKNITGINIKLHAIPAPIMQN